MSLAQLQTGITGLDLITHGGLPRNRVTLVSGTAGSAKTVLAVQFLAAGMDLGEPGVLVTLDERPADIKANMASLGWDLPTWEAAGKFAFVDATPRVDGDTAVVGGYDLGGLLARIEHAVRQVGATRLSMDSLGALFAQFPDTSTVRRDLFRITGALRDMGVTSMITAERLSEYGEVARYGIEDFVADNVIVLRNVLEQAQRRRTIEILKLRGAPHHKGEYAFTIVPDEGIVVLPLSETALQSGSTLERITTGIARLDELCGGGFFRDSIVLVSGATGTGKTLTATHYVGGGCGDGERCVYFAFEESRPQLIRNAKGWGIDFEAMERAGLLRIESTYAEGAGLEDHLIRMKATIDAFEPGRVAIDSLSALERSSTVRGFREFVMGLTSFVKQAGIGGMYTSTTPGLLGGASITDAHISTITDVVVLLRYVESIGDIHRAMTVLKMRGSMHDKGINEFTIGPDGLVLGRPLREATGILSGAPAHVSAQELEDLQRVARLAE